MPFWSTSLITLIIHLIKICDFAKDMKKSVRLLPVVIELICCEQGLRGMTSGIASVGLFPLVIELICCEYRKSSIKPPGGLFILGVIEGGLNREEAY